MRRKVRDREGISVWHLCGGERQGRNTLGSILGCCTGTAAGWSNPSVRGEPQQVQGEQREGSLPAPKWLLSHSILSVSNSVVSLNEHQQINFPY